MSVTFGSLLLILERFTNEGGSEQMIYLISIYTSNALGIAAILTAMFCNMAIMRNSRTDYRIIKLICVLSLIACCTDPLVFTLDGHGGRLYRIINMTGNSYLFLANIWVSVLWIGFLRAHLWGVNPLKDRKIRWILYPSAFMSAMIVINFFHPVVFSTSSQNVYGRLPFSYAFVILTAVFFAYSIYLSRIYKKENGSRRFFPIAVYLVPVSIGFGTQMLFYGISVSWPSVAIAACGIMMSLQNEMAYVDYLTGLLNRSYLFTARPYQSMKGLIMMDINSFKAINDQIGHEMGDRALREIGAVLHDVACTYGFAIRYGGDEFLVFSAHGSEQELNEIRDRIDAQLKLLNDKPGRRYQLSLSYGMTSFSAEQEDIDDIIRRVDQKMYENKKFFYQQHERRKKGIR